MSKLDLVTEIGDVLTQVDQILSAPGFSPESQQWHTLFALRKHLDDQQRELVRAIFEEDDAQFKDIAEQLSDAADRLEQTGKDIAKIGSILDTVSTIASLADKALNFVA